MQITFFILLPKIYIQIQDLLGFRHEWRCADGKSFHRLKKGCSVKPISNWNCSFRSSNLFLNQKRVSLLLLQSIVAYLNLTAIWRRFSIFKWIEIHVMYVIHGMLLMLLICIYRENNDVNIFAHLNMYALTFFPIRFQWYDLRKRKICVCNRNPPQEDGINFCSLHVCSQNAAEKLVSVNNSRHQNW